MYKWLSRDDKIRSSRIPSIRWSALHFVVWDCMLVQWPAAYQKYGKRTTIVERIQQFVGSRVWCCKMYRNIIDGPAPAAVDCMPTERMFLSVAWWVGLGWSRWFVCNVDATQDSSDQFMNPSLYVANVCAVRSNVMTYFNTDAWRVGCVRLHGGLFSVALCSDLHVYYVRSWGRINSDYRDGHDRHEFEFVRVFVHSTRIRVWMSCVNWTICFMVRFIPISIMCFKDNGKFK